MSRLKGKVTIKAKVATVAKPKSGAVSTPKAAINTKSETEAKPDGAVSREKAVAKILELLSEYLEKVDWDEEVMMCLERAKAVPKGIKGRWDVIHNHVEKDHLENFIKGLNRVGPEKLGHDLHTIIHSLHEVLDDVAKDVTYILNKYTGAFTNANTPRKQTERLLTLYTSVKWALSLKIIKDREQTIIYLKREIDELKKKLKLQDEEIEAMSRRHEDLEDDAIKFFEETQEKYDGLAEVCKGYLKDAESAIDEKIKETKETDEESLSHFLRHRRLNKDTGEGSTSSLKK